MDDDQIYAITDEAGQRVFDEIPEEHLAKLDEDARGQLLVDLQDALTDVLRRTLGKTAG